jgi:hypothetical protein
VWGRRAEPPSSERGCVEPLSSQQLQAVRAGAFEKARQLDLDAGRAALLADAIAGSLARGALGGTK